MEFLHKEKVVSRMLLREIVREVPEGRFLVHISNAALDVLLRSARTVSSTGGNAIKESLLADVRPWLSAAGGYNSAVVCVDTLVGTDELSFRYEARKRSLADCYFKQKDGTFGEVIANLRKKVQLAYRFFKLQKKCLTLLHHYGPNFELGKYLLVIYDLLLRFSPFANPSPKRAFEEGSTRKVVLENLPMVKEESDDDSGGSLEINAALAKASHSIVDAVVKIMDAPLQLPDLSARHYLFLCLDDDAKKKLAEHLTEFLISDSGKSTFTYVRLNDYRRGEEMKKLLIEKVKESPSAVFMLDGVEYADVVLYSSLLAIFDKGTLDDGAGFTVDFQRTIVILTSELANKRTIAKLFDYQPYVLRNMAMNQGFFLSAFYPGGWVREHVCL